VSYWIIAVWCWCDPKPLNCWPVVGRIVPIAATNRCTQLLQFQTVTELTPSPLQMNEARPPAQGSDGSSQIGWVPGPRQLTSLLLGKRY
jgi:hypothetical protein